MARVDTRFIGIDPGKRSGIAGLDLHGELTFAVTVQSADLLEEFDSIPSWAEIAVAVEYPVVYPGGRSPNPQHLLRLAFQCGQVQCLCLSRQYVYREVEPKQWGGAVPKRAKHARLRAAMPRLPDDLSEHALDAVGIARWLYSRRT